MNAAGASTRAGLAKVDISASVIGAEMAGYGNRQGGALSVHDPLFVRALVLESHHDRVAICSLDLCHVGEDIVRDARERVAQATGLAADQVFISTTHTHSGPSDVADGCWEGGLSTPIAQAVVQASERLQPARVGAGWGMLHGFSLNRRRLEDPVDPAVFVIRIDAADGSPLGLYYSFACHPVVLGPDNRSVSGDWPSRSSQALEIQLGRGAVAIFGQGASGDVNPLTAGMRKRFYESRAAHTRVAYYGSPGEDGPVFDVLDRTGATFAEADEMGEAVAREVSRVRRDIAPFDVTGLWTHQLMLASRPPNADPPSGHPRPRAAGQPLEVMLVGIAGPGIVLVGIPGEAFSGTGVALRRELRRGGIPHPFLVTLANGHRGYIPPHQAYPDGGYEVDWARSMGFGEGSQDEIRSHVVEALARRSPFRFEMSSTR